MAQQAFGNRNNPGETWVISRTEEGFRVYNPADPSKSYVVGGGPDEPTFTCPEFQHQEGDLRARCKHIQALLAQLSIESNGANTYDQDERQAIQNENLPEAPRKNGEAQMLLKRSVSPDGRIDSLSVEFSCPVGEIPAGDIKSLARTTLQLQAEIVQGFLAGNGRENGHQQPEATNGGNGPLPATMLTIGGINTKWGRRLYIAFQANGNTLKLFGSRKQLADVMVAAGFANLAERIDEGKQLNVACRVVTKPSEDGRYVNVEQVLPAESRPQGRRW
jgi:hypothetical protein